MEIQLRKLFVLIVIDVRNSESAHFYSRAGGIKSRVGRRFRGIRKRTKSIQEKTYDKVAKHIPEEVVIPIPYIRESPDLVKFPYSIRSPFEQLLSDQEATLMEQMKLREKLIKRIRDRTGRKGETLIKVCFRCFDHEIAWGVKGFKDRVEELFELKGAFRYPYTQLGSKNEIVKRTIYGAVFEQTEAFEYRWNPKEISEIRLTTPIRFRNLIYGQLMKIVPQEPPGDIANLKWIANKVASLDFDFLQYTIPLKSVKRKKAKGVYAAMPSRNDDIRSYSQSTSMT